MKITLRFSEVPLHLYQIIAGFTQLKRQGEIQLRIEKLSKSSSDILPYNMLEAVTQDGKRLIYDMNDGYANLLKSEEEIAPFYDKLLKRCDFLFKRSYSEAENALLCESHKIKKTAPNFFVTVRGNPAHIPVPCDPDREKIKKIIRMMPGTEYYNGHCLEQNFFTDVTLSEKPKVLFMARLWDPSGDFSGQLTDSMKQERFEINEMRAACIRQLRKETGDSFFGGITPSEFSLREYPDIILENTNTGKKNEYLRFMKEFDIHISTMGLHRSTGWKFAEYLASAKAVVCEPLYYESAGNLRDGENYLSFTDAESCVEKVRELLDNDRRYRMMQNNKSYADSYMHCDTLVRNTLKEAGIL